MKLKMYEIKNMKESLGKLIDKELPIVIAFRLTKLVKIIDKNLEDIEEFRIKLIKKYGVENKEKEQLEVPDDKIQEFSDEINTLLNEEVEIDFKPFDISSLGNDITFSTTDLIRLEKLFASE